MSDDNLPKNKKITSMYEKLKIKPKINVKEDDHNTTNLGNQSNEPPSLLHEELTMIEDEAEDVNETSKELKITKENLIRALADIENIRRRSEKDIANAHKYALKNFVLALLPTFDSLAKALAHAFHHPEAKKIHEGIALTIEMLLKVLNQFGIEPINPINDTFDPLLHEAMTMIDKKDAKDNSILEVLQKGYLLNGRLIRPARVIVAKSS